MKAVLEFDLDNYDDKRRFEQCNAADKMYNAIWNFKEDFRNILEQREYSETTRELLNNLYKELIDWFDDINHFL